MGAIDTVLGMTQSTRVSKFESLLLILYRHCKQSKQSSFIVVNGTQDNELLSLIQPNI